MKCLRKTGKHGFTLVELIAVVAILAILAGIAVPAVSTYVREANASADSTAAKNIENALKVSASEIKTGRATQTLKTTPTVEKSLENMDLQLSILTPVQQGCAFYFNKATQTVGVFQSAPAPAADNVRLAQDTKNTDLKDLGLT